jgi:hypothetical protein
VNLVAEVVEVLEDLVNFHLSVQPCGGEWEIKMDQVARLSQIKAVLEMTELLQTDQPIQPQSLANKNMSRKYVIINADEVSSVDFSQVKETSADTLRFSVDGSKSFVKFSEDVTPSFLEGKTQYTQSEMLTILKNAEWSAAE